MTGGYYYGQGYPGYMGSSTASTTSAAAAASNGLSTGLPTPPTPTTTYQLTLPIESRFGAAAVPQSPPGVFVFIVMRAVVMPNLYIPVLWKETSASAFPLTGDQRAML